MLKKTTQFKQLLQSDQLEFLMEAHNGMSAKIVEEAAELAAGDADIAPEAADLVYFALVKSVAAGVSVEDIERILDHRERRVTRRPIGAKEVE